MPPGKTQIVTAPMDMMIREGEEAKFTCTGTTDPEEVENLRISWKKDNRTINYELAQRVIQNAIDNSLTISGTMYLDTGKYTCVASNGLDFSEASAQLIVQGQALTIFAQKLSVRFNKVKGCKNGTDILYLSAKFGEDGWEHGSRR